MSMLKKSFLVAAVLVSGTAIAAQDGTIGATSQGTSDVTLVKENVVQITGVADLDLGIHNSTATALTAFDDVCVFNSTTNYAVTVSSANAAYELRSGTDAIPYTVNWTDSSNTPVALSNGNPAGGMSGDQTSLNCGGTNNASFAVSVTAADFNSANPGTYTDVLTLMIEPE